MPQSGCFPGTRDIRGLPYWLREVPNIIFRTDNEPFKVLSSAFFMTFNFLYHFTFKNINVIAFRLKCVIFAVPHGKIRVNSD